MHTYFLKSRQQLIFDLKVEESNKRNTHVSFIARNKIKHLNSQRILDQWTLNIKFYVNIYFVKENNNTKIQPFLMLVFCREFLAPGAPCEINIDGKTMEKVHQEMQNPSRFTFDAAQEHVYTLLLKKDCYPRFIRSEYYKNLLATGVQPSQKKR